MLLSAPSWHRLKSEEKKPSRRRPPEPGAARESPAATGADPPGAATRGSGGRWCRCDGACAAAFASPRPLAQEEAPAISGPCTRKNSSLHKQACNSTWHHACPSLPPGAGAAQAQPGTRARPSQPGTRLGRDVAVPGAVRLGQELQSVPAQQTRQPVGEDGSTSPGAVPGRAPQG